MKKQRFLLIITDIVNLALAFIFSLFIRQSSIFTNHFDYINYQVNTYLISFIIAIFLFLIVFGAFKLYQVRQIEFSARIFTVLKAFTVWVLIATTLIYSIKFDFSRGLFFMTAVFIAIFVCLTRYFLFKNRQNKLQKENIETIIIGIGDRANIIEKQIKESLPNASCKKIDYSSPSTHSYLLSHESTDIFIADELLSRDRVLSILANEDLNHHSFRVVLDVFRLATGEIHLNDIDEIPSITSKKEPATSYKITKRMIDVIASALSLLITSPLWTLIAIFIKIDSTGPILIKQTRIGWNSKPFTILKFRTMFNNASLYELAPQDETDRRITRVGKILRRFSLDELPQLWNIFIGDMSLVGPRPEMEFIVKNYTPWQSFRLKAKPGLTGLWQILGRKDIPLHENLEYDFYYVTNRSILLDSVIIIKTIPAVLFGRGAY